MTASLAALLRRGDLGLALPARANRDRVTAWCDTAAVAYELGGIVREHILLEVGVPSADRSLVLTLQFEAGDEPDMDFVEWHGPSGAYGTMYMVSIPLESVDALVDRLTARFGLDLAAVTGPEDRAIACFAALLERGELGSALPQRGNRDRVTGWLADAGLAHDLTGTERRELLLQVHRDRTTCEFTLSLLLDPDPHGNGITFSEFYDYLPTARDSGREYGYRVHTPYTSIDALVAFFESRLGVEADPSGDPEDRLTACFTTLVVNGELGDHLALKENRERVAAWFAEAGVEHEPTTWSWVN